MKHRYFIRPRLAHDDSWFDVPAGDALFEGKTVFETLPVDTGLVDSSGLRDLSCGINSRVCKTERARLRGGDRP